MMQFLCGNRGAALPCQSVDMVSTWQTAEMNIQLFMQEATLAGWKVTVFFDNAKIAEDERKTYMDRTKERFTAGGSAIIPNSGMVFGSLFNTFGAKVRYALGADNDATIAAHAHADDAAILSGDGDFLRYYGRRASGELFFLRRIFSRFSTGDERNHGYLALFPRQPPEDRHRADWTYTSAIAGDKGGKIRLLDPPPATSAIVELVTNRDASGAPRGIVANAAAYPFAFPCAPEHDFALLHRPLRLAAYALLGERRVVESHLVWSPLRVGAIAEWRTSAWAARPDGAWAPEPAADGDEEGGVADSWEELAEDAAADGGAPDAEEARRVRECAAVLARLRGAAEAGPDAALREMEALYAAVFPPGSLAPAVAHPDTGEAVRATAQQARNERLCRFAVLLRQAAGIAGERLAAQAFQLLMRFAARHAEA
jgi:hypothetical protein